MLATNICRGQLFKLAGNSIVVDVLENLFKNLFINQKQYLGFEPENICAVVNKTNFSSVNLFKKFGFSFKRKSRSYFWAENDLYSIKKILNSCEQEKI